MTPITFKRGGWRGVQALRNVGALRLSQDQLPAALSPEHMVMAYAHALGSLGMHIGMGKGEVDPERALSALTEGLRRTRAMATRSLREQEGLAARRAGG